MKIYVTGCGAISSIGHSVDEMFHALLAEKTGIKQGLNEFSSRYKVGEINLTNQELSDKFQLRTKGSRTSLLGMVAAKEAFQGHQISKGIRTGLISGTSVGGMDVSEQEYANYL
jgi:3-oxoacyl-[acyl-carrier-protein] synthase-1